MRRTVAAAVAITALVGGATASPAQTPRTALSLARVAVDGPDQAAYVAATFDETHVYDPGYVHVLLWPGDAARLAAEGLEHEVLVEDVVAEDRAARLDAERRGPAVVELPGPDRSDYRVLSDYTTELQALADKHPSLVRSIELPHPTHEGRMVHGVEISAGVEDSDGRPTFYVDGVHHAREWPAGEYPMIFAHYLVDGFRKVPRVTKLLKRVRVIVVPIVNVDGFHFSRSSAFGSHQLVDEAHGGGCSGLHCEAYWRKNRRSYAAQTLPVVERNPDAYGVDPNRNYGYLWGGGGSTSEPLPVGDQTYRGPAPASEPETQNVQDLLLSRNVTSIVSNHTYSRLVLRPWGDRADDSPDEAYLERLGGRMAKALGGFQNIKGIELYVTTGTMSEWGYGTFGVPSYTFEHGTSFHPPYTGCTSDCVETEWPRVMNAFMIAAEAANDPKGHGVISGRVVDGKGRPVKALLTVSRGVKNPLAPENPLGQEHHESTFETWMRARGGFTWHLPPSTPPHLLERREKQSYRLKVTAPGFRGRTLTFVLNVGQNLDLGTIRL